MPSKKILENQKNTAARLEKEAELQRHQDGIDKLEQLRKTQLQTTQVLIQFLNGKTTKTEITNQLKEIGTPDSKKVVAAIEKLTKRVNEKSFDLSPLTKLLEKVVQELEKKPNELPEAPESVEVDFTSTNTRLDQLIEKVGAIKLESKDAVVNVAAPKLTPLLDVLKQILAKDVDLSKIPEVSVFEENGEAAKAQLINGVVQVAQTNLMVSERYDSYKLLYDTWGSKPQLIGADYYLGEDLVASVRVDYEDGLAVGGRRVYATPS